MIYFLVAILLASLFLFDWLFFVMGVGGRVMTWVPEIITIIIAVSIPFKTATSRGINLPIKYGILLFLYLMHILAGFLLNDISGWTMLAGFRTYTRFLPIFLLPIFFPMSEKMFRNILIGMLALALFQFPIVLWQRFFQYATSLSGDPVGGTLGLSTSGILSIFLSSALSFLIAFYYKDMIPLPFLLIFGAMCFFPMTLNETKISFILLPVAFIFPAFFIRGRRDSIFKTLLVLVILSVAFITFKGVYDYFAVKRWGYGIEGFISSPEEMEAYNSRRINPIINAFEVGAFQDGRSAIFGRGAGNVSEGFTKILSGKYLRERFRYEVWMTFVKLIWEVGLLGSFFFFLFPLFIFWDSMHVSRQSGREGGFGLGMMSFTVFFVGSTVYTFTIDANVLIFLYFFMAGMVVSLRTRMEQREETSPIPIAITLDAERVA